MKRDDSVFIEDIIDCIRKVEEYLQDTSEHEFESNFEKQDAVIRRIEIIGEAVKNVSVSTKESFVDIPWKEMAGMRDIVIHQYFGVSIGLIWKTATSDLISLKQRFIEIKKSMEEDED